MLGDQGDGNLVYMNFGDNDGAQKRVSCLVSCTISAVCYSLGHSFKAHWSFLVCLKGRRLTNGNIKDYSDESRVSKARQRKKRGNSLPTSEWRVVVAT